MNCVFCEILYGSEPAKVVYDGISTLGIVPLNPVVDGHVIFLPRKHVRDASEKPALTAAVMSDAAEYIQHLRRRADSAANSPDFNIITSIGPAATQSVFHLHVHVVPRTANDGLALPWYSGRDNTASNHQSVELVNTLTGDLWMSLYDILGPTQVQVHRNEIHRILGKLNSPRDAVATLRSVQEILGTDTYGKLLRFHLKNETSLFRHAATLSHPSALAELGLSVDDLGWPQKDRPKEGNTTSE